MFVAITMNSNDQILPLDFGGEKDKKWGIMDVVFIETKKMYQRYKIFSHHTFPFTLSSKNIILLTFVDE